MNVELIAAELQKTTTEADVFIVCCTDLGTIQVSPFWECDEGGTALLIQAGITAAKFADEMSEGSVEAVVVDKRKPGNRVP